ncbi:MAG: GldG family protein, partial [Gemmatimonadetes bacterium]|nr:GldG family protein [Gemmatimonadota bacterium]
MTPFARALLLTVAGIALVAILDRRGGAIDLTRESSHTLSAGSERVVQSLPEPVEGIAFYRPDDPRTSRIERLLRKYADASPAFRYRIVDPDRFPGEAARYGVTVYGTTVLESGTRRRAIPNRSENAITTALLLLFDDRSRTIRIDESYGGRGASDESDAGLGEAAKALRASGFRVEPFLLAGVRQIPADTDVLVIAGPRIAIPAPAQDSLENFVRAGGRLLLLLDPETDAETAAFPQRFGIEAGAGVVVDPEAALYGGDIQTPVVARYDLHDATRGLAGASLFPRTRPLSLFERGRGADEVRSLITTGEDAWAENDLALLTESGKAVFSEGADGKGPLALAMSASVASKSGIRGRMIVFGDSDWASNRYFAQGAHAQLLLNAVKYLGWEGAALGLALGETTSEPLLLSRAQGRFFFWFGTAALPGIWAVFGF